MASVRAEPEASFESELFSPVEITKSVEIKPTTSHLSQKQRTMLMAARRVVIDFLRNMSKPNTDPLAFLTPELQQKYKTRMDLHAREFGDEAYLSVRVFDYSINEQQKEITLRIFLTGTREGTNCAYQRRFVLTDTPHGWKISNLS
jgi:hypothetical protein